MHGLLDFVRSMTLKCTLPHGKQDVYEKCIVRLEAYVHVHDTCIIAIVICMLDCNNAS